MRVTIFFCAVFLTGVATSPAQEAIQNNNFFLLYSTLGYESGGTKRALVRSVDPIDPASLSEEYSTWVLLDDYDNEVLSGTLRWLGVTFGVQLWEMRFTKVRRPGYYRLSVTLRDHGGQIIETQTSLEFEIARRIFTKRLLRGLAIVNGKERQAGEDWGGGLFDCNNTMGEAYSHGIFLSGLVDVYLRRRQELSETENAQLIQNIETVVDYLFVLHDDSTGEIISQHPTRPCQGCNEGDFNTVEGLYGLAKFMDAFKETDPDRAHEAFLRTSASFEYFYGNEGEVVDTIGLESLVNFQLFRYTGDAGYRDAAIDALDEFLVFESQAFFHWLGSWRGIPYFEGLYVLARELKDHPHRKAWMAKAREIALLHHYILRKNGFAVVPQSEGPYDWDEMESVPACEHDYCFYANTHFCTTAVDAIRLARLTGDRSLERIAAGSIGWLLGMNPGIPGEMVANPTTENEIAAAAFVMNLDARHAKAWDWWAWGPPVSEVTTIMNGFEIHEAAWSYENRWQSGETFIKHDGAFLSAMTLYEDYIAIPRIRRGVRRVAP